MRYLLVFLIYSVICTELSAADFKLPKSWRELTKAHQASLSVVRLSDSKSLLDVNSDLLLSTASVTKLATSIIALKNFTPHHTFNTKVYHSGRRSGDTVKGNLYFVGSGDPLLISEKLWQFAADIKNLGIKEFQGDIIIDNSLYTDGKRDSSRKNSPKVSHQAYDAPLSALGINFNTIALNISPNQLMDAPAIISTDPYPLTNVEIRNRTKTSKRTHQNITLTRQTDKRKTLFIAAGNVSPHKKFTKIYRSIENTTQVSGEYIRAFLKANDIEVSGSIRDGKKPSSATMLVEIEGYPLSKIIQGLNKYSNNYIADMLVKNMGAYFNKDGSMQGGIRFLKAQLHSLLGKKANFNLANGSGLDPQNKFSASQITQLLTYSKEHLEVFPELIASLAIAGGDGSLKKRFTTRKTKKLRGVLRAKTGSLTSPKLVSSLAGYFHSPKHGLLAFSLICNSKTNRKQSLADQRRLLDVSITDILLSI